MEFLFFFLFCYLIFSLFQKTVRILEFLIYLEVMSLFLIFCLMKTLVFFKHVLIMNILVLISCESAVGFSLLVVVVRSFSADNILNGSILKTFEGF